MRRGWAHTHPLSFCLVTGGDQVFVSSWKAVGCIDPVN